MKYLIIFFFIPFKLFSQDISGIWIGTLYNDTTKQTIQYEVAIKKNKGKFTGYSHTTFLVDKKAVVGVKSIKIDKQNENYFFEDDDLVYDTYPVAPPKGVKQISKLTLSKQGNSFVFKGKFTTTRTRQYGKQVTGVVFLEKKKGKDNSKLIAAMDNLGLSNGFSFVSQIDNLKVTIVNDGEKAKEVKEVREPLPVIKHTDPIAELENRKIETIETVYFTGDSIYLGLYDNGTVDGDSVSLIVNGEVLLMHQLLSTRVISKTIQTPVGLDSINIIMYAENLGTIAPNSGLLVIKDGDSRHDIFFSGDLQKNAAVLLLRQK